MFKVVGSLKKMFKQHKHHIKLADLVSCMFLFEINVKTTKKFRDQYKKKMKVINKRLETVIERITKKWLLTSHNQTTTAKILKTNNKKMKKMKSKNKK